MIDVATRLCVAARNERNCTGVLPTFVRFDFPSSTAVTELPASRSKAKDVSRETPFLKTART